MAIGRRYSVPFQGVAISTVQDLFGVYTGASKAVALHSIELGQITAVAVQLLRVRIRLFTGGFTAGSGGSTVTPRPCMSNDTASAISSAHINDTTQCTGGTVVDLYPTTWNLVNGWFYLPADVDHFVFPLSSALVLSLDTAPSASITANGALIFEELF